MIRSLIVGCSLLFVMCSGSAERKCENIDNNVKFYGTHTGNRIVGVQEISINDKKYILAIGLESVAICPSKNE